MSQQVCHNKTNKYFVVHEKKKKEEKEKSNTPAPFWTIIGILIDICAVWIVAR